MKKFIGYFENQVSIEIDNYANHTEYVRELIVKDMQGNKWVFIKLDMKMVYGKDMPIDIVYKCGFIKFERFEIVECNN